MKKTASQLLLLCFVLFLVSGGTSLAITIDFERLGLGNGDSVPTIGVASFDGSAAVQGSSFAFISPHGGNTGDSGSFSVTGNTFITNMGGLGSPESVKTLEIEFSTPVTNLQFDTADIDSFLPHTIERLTATVYDSSDAPIGNIVYEAPTSGTLGDGEVVNLGFGTLAGIRRLYIQVDNIGTVPSATAYGWGLDNLKFEIMPVCIKSFILGDADGGNYDGTGSIDDVYFDEEWYDTVNDVTAFPECGFDLWYENRERPFTFVYDLEEAEEIYGAELSLRIRAAHYAYVTDHIYLESLDNDYSFADLGWLPFLSTDEFVTLTLDLSNVLGDNLLPLLEDGQLNVMLQDDCVIDYAILTLTVACTSESIAVDIKPNSCFNSLNTKSKGVLPVAILGTEDFDVDDIDPSTIELEGVLPLRYSWEDVASPFNGPAAENCFDCTESGPDGYADLVLHFDTQKIAAAIGPVGKGDCLNFTIIGALFDETPIEGTDYILIANASSIPMYHAQILYVEEDGTSWWEVQLVDEEGNPVRNKKFELTLPDGSVEEGRLDKNGVGKIEATDFGPVDIDFPTLDPSSWERE